ncbi:MAG: glycosyltransferase family 2 protein [Gammaproteobacteria bacterium]
MDLAIVIPVLNEAYSLAPLLDEITTALAGETGYEIIVVDDGSTDATRDELSRCLERSPLLRVIHHPTRRGQSAAIATGVDAARTRWIVTLDGDGQNDPGDILRFYRTLREAPADVGLVIGHRARRRDTLLKLMSSRIANRVRAWVLGDDTPDSACGLKAFARETFMRLPRFDHMHRFLPALVRRQSGRVLSLEITQRERTGGRSKYGLHNRLWVGIVDLLGVWWLKRRALRPVVEERE